MRTYKGHYVKPRPAAAHPRDPDRWGRIGLWWTLAAILVVMLATAPFFAISADEPIQNWYGHQVLYYFTSGGANKTALTPWANICFYGGLFDGLCALIAKAVPYELYDTRHVINAISGFGVIWFSARLAKIYGGYPAAIVTALFLFLSPRFFGESMNNPKDIPFALGMTAGLYAIVRYVQAGPRPTINQCAWLAAAIAFAINIRIGGLLLIPYLCLFVLGQWWAVWRHTALRTIPEIARYAGILALICAAGWLGGVLFWPYGLQNPILNPLRALKLMSNAYIGATVLFDGQDYPTWQVPARYLPQWMAVSTPLLIVVFALLSPLLLRGTNPARQRKLLVLFFAVLFPLLYIIFNRSPLYDAWRHVMFIYPPLVILAALVPVHLTKGVKSPWWKALLWAGCAITFIPVGAWMVRSHPVQSVYYNELTNGIRGAHGRYETDFYTAGLEKACARLAAGARLDSRTDTIRLATNFWGNIPAYYLRRYGGRVQYVRTPYEDRYDRHWDYGIFRTRGADCYLIQNGAFPPARMVDAVAVDSVVLYAIVKADPMLRDATTRLARALADSAWSTALPLAQYIIKNDPRNETIHPRYALALLRTGHRQEAWDHIRYMLRLNPLDERARQLYKEMSGKDFPRRLKVSPPPTGWRTVLSEE